MNNTTEEDIDFENMPSNELLEYIALKDERPHAAERAFVHFCHRFEGDIKRKSEIYCKRYGYSEVIALEIAHCTFARVWKYPTFDIKKAKSKNVNKAILLWMYPILFTQIVKYGKENSCADPTAEENLELVTNTDELLARFDTPNVEAKREVRAKLKTIERALNRLSEKHQIIYFTYRAYQKQGKKIPRAITSLLRERLSLTQKSVNTYYGDAKKHVENYLSILNGNS